MAATRAPSGSSDPNALPNAGTWQTQDTDPFVERGDAERDPRAHAVTPQCDRKLIEFGYRPGGVDCIKVPPRLHPGVDLASRLAVARAMTPVIEGQHSRAPGRGSSRHTDP